MMWFPSYQLLQRSCSRTPGNCNHGEGPSEVVRVEDLTMVVETAISTTKKKFGHSRHRIELCLFLQLARLTANRPRAVLSLRYRHIRVSLLFLLGLLFADRAFKRVKGEEVLTSAEQLPRLYIRDGYNELPLLLSPALNDVPVFRQTERTLQGIGISADKCLPYSTLLP
jgi:hypothetical protein